MAKEDQHSSTGNTSVLTAKPKGSGKTKVSQLPPYNVILLDDDDHSHEYVIEMLKVLFGHPQERGFMMAVTVNDQGRCIVLTTHKEKAELKRDQIHSYGADPLIPTCKGSMSAVIEPAEGS